LISLEPGWKTRSLKLLTMRSFVPEDIMSKP
jgi:hypothetical protein